MLKPRDFIVAQPLDCGQDLEKRQFGRKPHRWQIDCLYQLDSCRYQTLLVCRYRSMRRALFLFPRE